MDARWWCRHFQTRSDRALKLFKGAGQNRPAATPWTTAPHQAEEQSPHEPQLPAVKTNILAWKRHAGSDVAACKMVAAAAPQSTGWVAAGVA